MDLGLTEQQDAFRQEVCGLLSAEPMRACIEEIRRRAVIDEPGMLGIYRELGSRGLLAVHWPAEYGGLGGSIVEKAILTEELILHGVPDIVHTSSIDYVGQALLMFGTEQQRARLLPGLARGERSASVLLSEPEAGSDLASLTTRAEPDGDGWRLYGRKIYNMKSHVADIALCAARTTESSVKYHGITLFIVPMKSPGVIIEPLWCLSNDRFCDVRLDGIRLGTEDVLGAPDDGWQLINKVLGVERTGIEYEAKARRLLDLVTAEAGRTGRLTDPAYGQRLVQLDAQARAGRLLAWNAVSNLARGEADPIASAMAKWYVTEVVKAVAGHGIETLGLDGLLTGLDEQAPLAGGVESGYRDAAGWTLAGGTSEIMLSIVASNGLGLPS